MLLLLHFPVIMCLNVIFCYFSVSFQSRFRTQFFPLIHVLVVQMVKSLSGMQETWVQSLGWEDSLEKAMAPHSSVLAWRISGMGEPGGCRPWGCKESDTTERLHFHFHFHILLSHLHLYTELYIQTCNTDSAIAQKHEIQKFIITT